MPFDNFTVFKYEMIKGVQGSNTETHAEFCTEWLCLAVVLPPAKGFSLEKKIIIIIR